MTQSLLSPELLTAAQTALTACAAAGQTIALAESCTGGLIAAALTSIPGSSAVFEGGFVTYANIAKETMLGVAPSLIRTHGAVSEEVASAMVRGVLEETSAGVAVAVTGIAGPGGGSDTKPVGLVHLVAQTADGRRLHAAPVFPGDRQAVRVAAAVRALEMMTALAAG